MEEQIIIPIEKYQAMKKVDDNYNEELKKREKEIDEAYYNKYNNAIKYMKDDLSFFQQRCTALEQSNLKLSNDNAINRLENNWWDRFLNFIHCN